MELRHLAFFSKVAELEHITEAADHLDTSQPFVSRTIRELEAELGVELFEHVGRRIRLNEHGHRFYTHVREILLALDYAKAEMRDAAEAASHRVVVVTNVGLYMPDIVASLQQSDPMAWLTLTGSRRERMIEDLVNCQADFALCVPSLDEEAVPGVLTENLMVEGAYVVFSPSHPFFGRDSVDVSELAGLDYYTSPKGFGMRDSMDRVFEKAGIQPRIAIETPDTALIPRLLRAGLGFAFIPMSAANRRNSQDLWIGVSCGLRVVV